MHDACKQKYFDYVYNNRFIFIHLIDSFCRRDIDRIFVYNYTEEVENVTFVRNVTYTRKNCSVMDLLLSPNTDHW